MRNLVTSLKKIGFGIALGAAMGLFAAQPAALAANGFELNFGLFGPGYEGKLPSCESALGEISSQFVETAGNHRNSPLQIQHYSRIHEKVLRHWQFLYTPPRTQA